MSRLEARDQRSLSRSNRIVGIGEGGTVTIGIELCGGSTFGASGSVGGVVGETPGRRVVVLVVGGTVDGVSRDVLDRCV